MSTSVNRILSLVKADAIDLDALEAALEEASHEERVEATRQFDTRTQARLFEAAQGRAVPFEQIVPTDEPLREVIHVGTNTLPAFRAFEKRFCLAPDTENGERRAYGYNHNWFWPVTSPGYYVAREDDNGEFLIDYTRRPTEKPESWPPIMSNAMFLGLFVFYGMKDRLRRVSEHVTIGRAYKRKPMNAWFVLTRDDRF